MCGSEVAKGRNGIGVAEIIYMKGEFVKTSVTWCGNEVCFATLDCSSVRTHLKESPATFFKILYQFLHGYQLEGWPD